MTLRLTGLVLCSFLIGCGGTAPFGEDATEDTGGADPGGDTGGDEGVVREGLPPGTASPSPSARIVRTEPRGDGATLGNGFATDVVYQGPTAEDPTRDRFLVDGLAFDGGNVYGRGVAVGSLNDGAFAVYEADGQYPDSVNGQPITQGTHRAIYGVSRNRDADGTPASEFAIVRTGAYRGYGFGGFVYQRNGDVTLPDSGQAVFSGRSAGVRDFDGRAGLEYTTANVDVAIDFNDFNPANGVRGDAVRGSLSNRRVYDIDGRDITAAVVGRINAESNASLSRLPDAQFKVGPGVMDSNGEAVGAIDSTFVDDTGAVQVYEDGTYYAIVSGDDPNEIVGVVVMENGAEFDDATVRETSGFIVYRDPAPAP